MGNSRVVQNFPACLVRKAPPCCVPLDFLVLLFLFICRVVFIVVNLYTYCTQVKYVASSIKSWRELESSVLRQVSQLEMNKRGEH